MNIETNIKKAMQEAECSQEAIKNDKLIDKLKKVLNTSDLAVEAKKYIDNSYEQNEIVKNILFEAITNMQDDIYNNLDDYSKQKQQGLLISITLHIDDVSEVTLLMDECFELMPENLYNDLINKFENGSHNSPRP